MYKINRLSKDKFVLSFSWLLFTLLFKIDKSHSQIPSNHYTTHRFYHYNTDNGLPQNTVDYLTFDDFGRLHIGTQGGYVVFDGKQFHTKFNTPTFYRTFLLFKTKVGKIYWIPFNHNALFEINTSNMTLQNICKSGESSLKGIYADSITITNIDSTSKYYNLIKQFKNQNVLDIKSLKTTYLYNINTQPGNLSEFLIINDKLFKNEKGLLKNISENNKAAYKVNFPKNWLAESFVFYDLGKTYILYKNNIYLLTIENYKVKAYEITKNVQLDVRNDNIVSGAYFEKKGIFAFGTSNNGFYIVEIGNMFSTKYLTKDPNDVNKNNLYSLAITPQNDILCQNNYLINKNNIEISLFPKSQLWRTFNFTTSKGRVLTYYNECIYEVLNKKTIKLNGSLNEKGTFVISATQFNDSILYFISESSLYKLNLNTNTFFNLALKNLPKLGEQFRYINKYDESHLLILTNSKVYIINIRTHELELVISNSDSDYRIAVPVLGHEKQFWIGTYGSGFYLCKEKSLIKLPLDKNGYLKYPHTFMEDSKGYLWVSTNKGLFQIRKSDLLAYCNAKIKEIYYHYYDKSYGFGTNEFNGGCQSPAIETHDSMFIFSSINGLVQFYPHKIHPLLPDEPIFIQSIKIDTSTILTCDTVFIGASQRNIEVVVNSPYHGHSYNQNLNYRLNEESWIEVPSNNIINLSNPGNGVHQLEVRKLSGFGENNYVIKRLTIVSSPRYYQTWWFYILCILLFVLFAYLIAFLINKKNVNETKRLESMVKERNKEIIESNFNLKVANEKNHLLLSILLHDVKSPLKLISDISTNTQHVWNKLTEEDKILIIKDIKSTSHKVYFKVQQYLTWISISDNRLQEIKEINLKVLLTQIVETFKISENISNNNLKLILECPSNIVIFTFAHLVEVIIHNLIDNSLKYTLKGVILIYAFLENDFITIGVKDSGIGMNQSQIDNITNNGYKNNSLRQDSYRMGYIFIKDMIKQINGQVYISSTPDEGTDVKIIWKVKFKKEDF